MLDDWFTSFASRAVDSSSAPTDVLMPNIAPRFAPERRPLHPVSTPDEVLDEAEVTDRASTPPARREMNTVPQPHNPKPEIPAFEQPGADSPIQPILPSTVFHRPSADAVTDHLPPVLNEKPDQEPFRWEQKDPADRLMPGASQTQFPPRFVDPNPVRSHEHDLQPSLLPSGSSTLIPSERAESANTIFMPIERVELRQEPDDTNPTMAVRGLTPLSPLKGDQSARPTIAPGNNSTAPESEPANIHISIGRIDIRVHAPPVKPSSSNSNQNHKALTLEDYLRQRRGGREG
jgi:hypothetical protein